MEKTRWLRYLVALFLALGIFVSGCANMRPTTPQTPAPPYSTTPPSDTQVRENADQIVTYNYGETGPVQLSANNVAMQVGQKLVLQPAAGLTKNTRFVSSGENFFGDVMKQEADDQISGKVVFTAIKPGKGRLKVIPNTTEEERATDFWVIVQ